MNDDDEKYKIARKRAKAKIDFLRHLVTYVIVISFLAIINNIMIGGGYQWWLWAAFGWGIGIVSHFFQVYAFKGSLFEEKMIKRELEMMDNEKKDYQE